MRPIVESLFSELTLLGFIGLTLFLVFKMAWLKELSEKLYGEENEITELGEAVHMVLFLIMVIFLAQAVLMAQMGERILSTWKTWEQRKIESFSPKAIVDAKSLSHASFFELIFIAGLPEHTRILLHALCRDRFIMAHRLNPADFEFASYLGIALGKTLAEIVEVPVKTWLQLEVVLLVFWQMDNVMDRSMRFVFWVFIGYSLLFVTFAVHAKIRQILLEHTAPLLTRAEARGGGAGLLKATKLLPPRRALSRSSPLKKKRESIRADSLQIMKSSTRAKLFGDRVLEEESDEEKGGEGGAPPAPDAHVVDVEVRRGGYQSVARGVEDYQPRHKPEWLERLLLFYDDRVKPLVDAILGFAKGDENIAVRHRKRASVSIPPGVDPRYQCKFWYGETHKAHFTLDILRTIPLGMAIYIAVLLLVYLPQLFEDQVFKPFPFLFRLAWVFVALGPPMVCQYKLPRIVQDFAVVANVESLQNLRNIEQVIRRQKTEAAFEALKVVSFLRKPDVVARVLEGDGAATMTRHEHAMAQSRTNEDEHARRERIEIARAEDDRQERSWRAIFNVFDNDHEGSIDHDEMKALLSKFSDDSSPAGSEQIDKIIKLLDDDGSGEISFDEFFVFGRALERHVATSVDPAELIQDMFDIIDEDRGGLITVQELHQTISEIGQELSVDDARARRPLSFVVRTRAMTIPFLCAGRPRAHRAEPDSHSAHADM